MILVAPIELKALRRAAGYTQTELAEIVGSHQVHVSKIERGKVSPSVEMMERFTKALGLAPIETYSFISAATGEKKEVEVLESCTLVGKSKQIYKFLKLKDGYLIVATGKFRKE